MGIPGLLCIRETVLHWLRKTKIFLIDLGSSEMKLTITSIFLLCILSGCGGSSSGGSDGSVSEMGTPQSGTVETTGENQVADVADNQTVDNVDGQQEEDSEAPMQPVSGDPIGGAGIAAFDGRWETDCLVDDIDGSGIGVSFERVFLVLSGGDYVQTINSFLDSDCSVDDDPAVGVITGNYSFPGGSVSTAFGQAQFIDVTPESIVLDGEAFSGEELMLLEDAGFFDTEFDIIVIGTDGRLYGGSDIGLTPDTRPQTIDPEFSYRRL